jgi:hypothetical protein
MSRLVEILKRGGEEGALFLYSRVIPWESVIYWVNLARYGRGFSSMDFSSCSRVGPDVGLFASSPKIFQLLPVGLDSFNAEEFNKASRPKFKGDAVWMRDVLDALSSSSKSWIAFVQMNILTAKSIRREGMISKARQLNHRADRPELAVAEQPNLFVAIDGGGAGGTVGEYNATGHAGTSGATSNGRAPRSLPPFVASINRSTSRLVRCFRSQFPHSIPRFASVYHFVCGVSVRVRQQFTDR